MTQRRQLTFADTEAVAAEVRRLRGGGYTRAGNWTLAQICFHLNSIMRMTMRPGPHAPVQPIPDAAEKVKTLLAGQTPPGGLQAPDFSVPPPNTPMSAIDDYLKTLPMLKAFPGPFAPHRLFGELPAPDFKRLHLIHSAHHLGFLIPNSGGPAKP